MTEKKKQDEQATTKTKDGEVTIHVDTSNPADHDPSKEIPAAAHTIGTAGVLGTAAGSSQRAVAPTGNAEPLDPIDTGRDGGPEKKDIRELQPKAVEKRQKEEEKQFPCEYATEIDGEVHDDLNIHDALKGVYNALVAGSSSGIIHRKDKRFATITTEDRHNQKYLVIQPEDGKLTDAEADALNDYNHRVLTGPLS